MEMILGILSIFVPITNKCCDTILKNKEMECNKEMKINKEKCDTAQIIIATLCSTVLGITIISKTKKKQENITKTDKIFDKSKIVEMKGVA